MNVIASIRQGSLVITNDSFISGQQIGHVLLKSGAELFVKGIILGDLEIEEGAKCVIHGTVIGSIRNRGTLNVYGLVNGKIFSTQNASLLVDPESKVLNPSLNLLAPGSAYTGASSL